MKTIYLQFDGYWLELGEAEISGQSGIYCVFTCEHNFSDNSVILHKLLYIGESGDVNDRHQNHERLPDWEAALEPGEVLCYSFANVEPDDRKRAEAALIFKHKPPKNTKNVKHFDYPKTEIFLLGETELLVDYFTVP